MVAPADLERDWLFRLNVVPPQATPLEQFQNVLLLYKRAHTGEGTNLWRDPIANTLVTPSEGLWTVDASSNGVVADANDNWDTAADIVVGTGGAARSWIVLRSPAGMLPAGRYIQKLIACDIAGTESIRIVKATNGFPFNLGAPSTTATPANPTNAAENTLAADRQILENDPTPSDHHLHMLRSNTGDIVFCSSRDGSGRMDWVSLSAFLLGHALDNYPYIDGYQGATSGEGGASIDGLWNGTTVAGAAGTHGHWLDGTVIDNQLVQRKLNSTLILLSTAGASGDGISAQFHTDALLFASNATAARQGLRGRWPDLGAKYPQGVANNTIEPGSDAIRRITIGDFVFLTDGSETWSF